MRNVIIIICLLSAALSSAHWLYNKHYFDSSLSNIHWFDIKKVSIQTKWPITKKEIQKLLPALDKSNLLVVKPQDLIEDIRKHPWAGSVVIKKRFPSHLSVRVDPIKPHAIYQKNGRAYFLDSLGGVIERVKAPTQKRFDLPSLYITRQKTEPAWELVDGVALLDKLRSEFPPQWDLSQLVLDEYPYFRVFLTNPRVEVLLSRENWEVQLPALSNLLEHPPVKTKSLRKINLVYPKKAIVS